MRKNQEQVVDLILEDGRLDLGLNLKSRIKDVANHVVILGAHGAAVEGSIRKLIALRMAIEDGDLKDKIELVDLYRNELNSLILLSILE